MLNGIFPVRRFGLGVLDGLADEHEKLEPLLSGEFITQAVESEDLCILNFGPGDPTFLIALDM